MAKARKSRAKKAVLGVVGKPATPRASKRLNELRLEEDKAYYESLKDDSTRRTKPSARHKRGLPLSSFEPVYARGGTVPIEYISNDQTERLSVQQFKQLNVNPYAVPTYTPVHGYTKSGKKTIKRFRNSVTGHVVSPYYRYHYFGREFNRTDTEEQVDRSNAYIAAMQTQAHAKRARSKDLVGSYQLLHPKMTRADILRSNDFQGLVIKLEQLHASAYDITDQTVEEIDTALGGSYDPKNIPIEKALLKEKLGENQEYKDVLVALGRRLPSDTNAVGESDPNHIKNTVRPALEALVGAEDFEEE